MNLKGARMCFSHVTDMFLLIIIYGCFSQPVQHAKEGEVPRKISQVGLKQDVVYPKTTCGCGVADCTYIKWENSQGHLKTQPFCYSSPPNAVY